MLKREVDILSAAAKMQPDDINKKKLQTEAVIVMDKTLKKEKDRQGQLDREVSVQWSKSHFVIVNGFMKHR